jgi:DNA-binding winged helix-turn-helix (wHTH) protein
MASQKQNGTHRRLGRRWSFANCVFDENVWALLVDGRRVALEAKPLELLHELLLGAGKVVTKDELLDRIWPDVIVVEASLPTAVRKLRLALGDDGREEAIVQTVAGVGYRLAVPVEVERRTSGPSVPSPAARAGLAGGVWTRRVAWFGAGLAAIALLLTVNLGRSGEIAPAAKATTTTQAEARSALRRLDVERIEAMIAAGWDPNTPFDQEGSTALTLVLQMCEWDRDHDQRRMMLMARTLHDAGAYFDRPNVWGDTAYSIAKAPRYCGPNHPVTRMLHELCYGGPLGVGDRCLATYELERRRQRQRQRQQQQQAKGG